MEKNKVFITKEQIIDNEPRELEVPGLGWIKVKDPTKGDRRNAEKKARSNELWDQWDSIRRKSEFIRQLVFKIVVDPNLSEDKDEYNQRVVDAIVDVVSMDLTLRHNELLDKRGTLVKRFLEVMKAEIPSPSQTF